MTTDLAELARRWEERAEKWRTDPENDEPMLAVENEACATVVAECAAELREALGLAGVPGTGLAPRPLSLTQVELREHLSNLRQLVDTLEGWCLYARWANGARLAVETRRVGELLVVFADCLASAMPVSDPLAGGTAADPACPGGPPQAEGTQYGSSHHRSLHAEEPGASPDSRERPALFNTEDTMNDEQTPAPAASPDACPRCGTVDPRAPATALLCKVCGTLLLIEDPLTGQRCERRPATAADLDAFSDRFPRVAHALLVRAYLWHADRAPPQGAGTRHIGQVTTVHRASLPTAPGASESETDLQRDCRRLGDLARGEDEDALAQGAIELAIRVFDRLVPRMRNAVAVVSWMDLRERLLLPPDQAPADAVAGGG